MSQVSATELAPIEALSRLSPVAAIVPQSGPIPSNAIAALPSDRKPPKFLRKTTPSPPKTSFSGAIASVRAME